MQTKTAENNEQVTSIPEANRPFSQLLGDMFTLYFKHGVSLTVPLLIPVAQQILAMYLGYYASFSLSTYCAANAQMGFCNPLLQILLALVIGVLTALLFCRGFWQWMMYFVSLNIDVASIVNNTPANFKQSYQVVSKKVWPYVMFLKLYFWATVMPFFAAYIGLIALSIAFPLQAQAMVNDLNNMDMLPKLLQIGGYLILLAAITIIPMLLFMVFLALGYQVIAFEKAGINPFPVAKKSWQLVMKTPLQTIILMVILFLVTTILAPLVFEVLFKLTGLIQPLNAVHHYFVQEYLNSLQSYAKVLPVLQGSIDTLLSKISVAEMAEDFSVKVISYAVVNLMLPLGTIGFTLLYFKAKVMMNSQSNS